MEPNSILHFLPLFYSLLLLQSKKERAHDVMCTVSAPHHLIFQPLPSTLALTHIHARNSHYSEGIIVKWHMTVSQTEWLTTTEFYCHPVLEARKGKLKVMAALCLLTAAGDSLFASSSIWWYSLSWSYITPFSLQACVCVFTWPSSWIRGPLFPVGLILTNLYLWQPYVQISYVLRHKGLGL
jgi:hypothetical protein